MKKIFTFGLLALLATITATAQGYRKWDFTNWSPQTIANLKADAAASSLTGWSDIEKKADAGEGKVAPEATAGKCFWLTDAEGGTLKANGVPIAELEGLDFGPTYSNNRSLAIAIDYPTTSLGTYAGPQYLWLGGGGKNMVCFTIPKVRIGQKITMTVESHKPSDARGVELYVGSIAAENKIGESFKPTTQETYTWEEGWTLPEGATSADGETVDIIVYNTSGCHLYLLEVGDNTQKAKVGFIYGGSLDADLAYKQLSTSDKYTLDPIEESQTVDYNGIIAHDAIVISSTVTNADLIRKLDFIQPYVPTLNLNPAIYPAWESGTLAEGHMFAVVNNPNHALFKGLELLTEGIEEGKAALPLTQNVMYQGVTLSGYFKNDQVLANVMESEAVAIHCHNMNHNGYIFIPYTQETLADAVSPQLLNNAIELLTNTKSNVITAPAPTFSFEYKHLSTTVSLSSAVTTPVIFYTTDGSEPTMESTMYKGPFVIDQPGVTVKAVVIGDGYNMSEVAEQVIELKEQAKQPSIAQTTEDGKATVTLTSDIEGAQIYYNYTGSTSTTESTLYTEPVVVTIYGRTIYAFTVVEGKVNSELTSQAVAIDNAQVRVDVLAHMDANSETYNSGSTSTKYFFSWAKDKAAHPYFDTTAEPTIEVDPDTGDEKPAYPLNAEEEVDFGNGWAVRSRGQLVTWENLSTGTSYGSKDGYNFATVDDNNPYFPVTKAIINLADKNTQPSDQTFPYNAYIVTTQKFKGPFDIVANVGSIVKPENDATHTVVFQVSADGNAWESNWQVVGDTIVISNRQRLTTNVVRSYEGTDEVYVRTYLCGNNSKVGFYDIYIANAGEKSQELLAGIDEQKAETTAAKVVAVYSLNGSRLNATRRGVNIVRYSDGTARKVLVK